MKPVRAELNLRDEREFSLVDYGTSHAWAVFRGMPVRDDDVPFGSAAKVLDVVFLGLERIASWRHVKSLHVRMADQAQKAALEERIGRIRRSDSVYFIEEGSLEHYVIASRVYWAEYDLTYDADSPLVADSGVDGRASGGATPPLGPIRYADWEQ
ncbi:hypothetical protein [Allokutzneria albata]|uniref:hypothetical protein n=1 Tax=Allokutzneria albata TaxID=211114 RepID=UPI0004C3A414|nr:hypothetical protein [Allokutzneria albata]